MHQLPRGLRLRLMRQQVTLLPAMRLPVQQLVPERWLEQVQRPSWCLRPVPQV